MTKLAFIFCLFVSTLAPAASFASSSNNPTATLETQSTVVEVAAVGFDKVLSMVVWEETVVKIQILDKAEHIKYASQFSSTEMEVVALDLKRLPAGTYSLKITIGDQTQTETLILP
ncbi:MAG: hypothetical protein AAGA10_17140 [Bacteroidota bacterium]